MGGEDFWRGKVCGWITVLCIASFLGRITQLQLTSRKKTLNLFSNNYYHLIYGKVDQHDCLDIGVKYYLNET